MNDDDKIDLGPILIVAVMCVVFWIVVARFVGAVLHAVGL